METSDVQEENTMSERIPETDPDVERKLQAYQEEVRGNFKRNFLANVFEGALVLFAYSLISVPTVLPAFVRRLGGSNLMIGLIPGVYMLGWFMPQIFVANYTERMDRKKGFIFGVSFGQRIPWLLLSIALFMWDDAGFLLGVFFLLFSISAFSVGAMTPAWVDLYSKAMPVTRRGRFAGLRSLLGNLLGVFGGWTIGRTLGDATSMKGYANLFLLSFLMFCCAFGAFLFNRESSYPIRKKPVGHREYFKGLPQILRTDLNFRRFVIAYILLSLGTMSNAFLTVNGLDRFQLLDSAVGRFTMITMAGQVLGTLVFGILADAYGNKLNFSIAAGLWIGASVLAALATSPGQYELVFALTALTMSAMLVSRNNIVVEFCRPEDRPTYLALSSVAIAPFVFLGPLLGAKIADAWGYNAVFITAGTVTLTGLLILQLWVQEPRHSLVGEELP